MFWRRHRKTDRPDTDACAEATEAQAKADDDLRDTQGRSYEIKRVVAQATRYGEENNFAEMISRAFGGAK